QAEITKRVYPHLLRHSVATTLLKSALTTARISSSRGRPPGLGGGIKSLIRSHSASVRAVRYVLAVIPPVFRNDATYGRLFKQPLRILDILPGSPAHEVGLRPGDVI